MTAVTATARMQRAAEILDSLISGRRDVHARKYEDAKGEARAFTARVKRDDPTTDIPLTPDVWLQHLYGNIHVGVYPMLKRGEECVVRWVCIDVDRKGGWDEAKPIARDILAAAKMMGIPAQLERSKGKGAHIWIFLDDYTDARSIRAVARHLVERSGHKVKGSGKGSEIAIYPKQDELGPDDPYGNLVFAPWAGRIVREGKTAFLDPETLEPYTDQVEAAAAFERLPIARVHELVGGLQLPPANVLQMPGQDAAPPPPPKEKAPEPDEDDDDVADSVRCAAGAMPALTDAEYQMLCRKLPALRSLTGAPSMASYDEWFAGLIHLVPFANGREIVHQPRFHDPARYDHAGTERKWAEAIKVYERPDRAHAPSISQRIIEHARGDGRPDVIPISYRYGIQHGRFVMREFVGSKEMPPKPLCNFVAQVLSVESIDDGAETVREMQMMVEISGGRTFRFSIGSGEWPELKPWLAKACAHTAIVYDRKGANAHVLEAIALYSMDSPHTHVYSHTGWVGGTFILTQGEAAGDKLPDDSVVRIPVPNLDRYKVAAGDAVRAYDWVEELFKCADMSATVPLVTTIFLAPLSSAVSPRYSLMLAGRSGSKKTSLVCAALNLFGTTFDMDNVPMSFFDTSNTIENVGHWAKDLPLLIDNYVPRNNKEAPDKLFRILHSAGDGVGRGRTDRTGRKVHAGKPFRCIPIITGEDFPTEASDLARAYVVEMTFDTCKPAALNEVQKAGERGELQPAMHHYLHWLRGKMADPAWAPAVRAKYLEEARKMQMHSSEHGRLLGQMAWFNVALDLMTESHPRGRWLDESLVAKARAALRSHSAVRSAMMTEQSVTCRFFQAVVQLVNAGIISARAASGREPHEDVRAQGAPAHYPGPLGWRTNAQGWPDQLRHPDSRGDLWVHTAKTGEPYLFLEPEHIIETYRKMYPTSTKLSTSASAISNALQAEGYLWTEKSDKTHKTVKWTAPGGRETRVWRIHLASMMGTLGLNRPDANDEPEPHGTVRLDE